VVKIGDFRNTTCNKLKTIQLPCSLQYKDKSKGKAVPLQAWSGPEGSRKLKVPRLDDNGTKWW